MKAAQNGHSSVVKLLLAAKAPVNYAPSTNGSTALFQATDNEQTECVRVLLNNGADANITYDLKVHCLKLPCTVHACMYSIIDCQIKDPIIYYNSIRAAVTHRIYTEYFCVYYQNHCFCHFFCKVSIYIQGKRSE